MSWSRKLSEERIARAIEDTKNTEIVELTSPRQFDDIPLTRALRVEGVHIYVEVLNTPEMVDSDKTETERSHKRLLRFLNLYQRVAHHVFRNTTAHKVDFQNQRLHFVVVEPTDDERGRVASAVTISAGLQELVDGANDLHDELADAQLAFGIDSGSALAVRNGTRGDRELLFLGDPANQAAKLCSGKPGIFLTNHARQVLDSSWGVSDPSNSALTTAQVTTCKQSTSVELDVDALLNAWRAELQQNPLAAFQFSRATPPLKDLDLEVLTPKNSKRLELLSIFADLDGFTTFVHALSSQRREGEAVQALHVLRKELRDVLRDFGGRKVRYVGDCIQGVLAKGSAATTDAEASVTAALLCAAAMRDAFGLVQAALSVTSVMGLGVGLDFGPASITRLGVKGSRNRCTVGQTVLSAQSCQESCTGSEVALGRAAWSSGSPAVQALFSPDKPVDGQTYNELVAELKRRGDPHVAGLAAVSGPELIWPRAWCW